MDAVSSANGLVKPISILDAVIWTAEVKKQTSPQTLQSSSQKARFSTAYVSNEETNESKSTNSRKHSIRYIWKHWGEGYDNEDEARAAPKEINEFLENHQQSKEKKELQKQLEACKLKSYDDAHKIITELKECSLTQNNSEPSDIICRVRTLIANQASEPNTYM